jgi:hypothetical protein
MADLLSASGAAVRTADALLRGTGGRVVLLRLPAPGIPGDPTEQLGLAAPEFQDVELGPVVIYGESAKGANAGTRDMLVSASAVSGIVGSLGYSAAGVLFAVAYGVLVDGVLMEVVSAGESEVGGVPYVYRLVLKMPVGLAV